MNKLREMLVKHEGKELTMYQDSKGIWTVGVGRNMTRPISEAVCQLMLTEDINDVIAECERSFDWFHNLDEVRRAAIIDMVFNMGMPTFKTFRNTISFMANAQYLSAGAEILRGSGPGGKSRYWVDVGNRALEISEMLKTGHWQ